MFEKRSDLVRFLAVVETGGFGRAADRLDMTQPAPSRVLARLERDLGARLFERTAAGVEDVIRTGSAGLLLMTTGPYLARLTLDFLERLPGAFPQPVPVTFGRYRSGFIARRSAENLPPFRCLKALVTRTRDSERRRRRAGLPRRGGCAGPSPAPTAHHPSSLNRRRLHRAGPRARDPAGTVPAVAGHRPPNHSLSVTRCWSPACAPPAEPAR